MPAHSHRPLSRVGWALALALTLSAHFTVGCSAGAQPIHASYAPSSPAQAQAPAMMESEATATGSTADSDGSPPPGVAPGVAGGESGGGSVLAGPRPARAAAPGMPGRGPAGNTSQPAQPANAQGTTPPANVPAPMLIYTAVIDMQSERGQVVATLDRVAEAATAMGGFLIRRTDTSVQVRVPSPRFREGLRQLETFGEVLHRSISADDVSEEFHDMEVRLQNLRAVRQRLEQFLARAANMQEALTIERELERVTREIDTIEGRMRFLSARVAFSLVTVNVRERPSVEPLIVAPPPPRRLLALPVEWLNRLGLNNLLNVREP